MTSNGNDRQRILGTLGAADGRGVVRMEDRYDTGIEDLWSAITDPQRLARWLGRIDGDLRLGGEYHAYYFASGWEGTVRIEVCEPPRRLRLANASDLPDPHVTEVTLTADGDQTVLVVEERGMPLHMVAGYGAGIQVHVEDLTAHIAGRERCDSDARMAELYPAYQVRQAAMN
jgi:uncharacterized protein YndB with AHSA1/START domain